MSLSWELLAVFYIGGFVGFVLCALLHVNRREDDDL